MQTEQRTALGRVSSSRLNAQRTTPPTTGSKARARMSLGPGTTLPRYSLGGGGMMTGGKKGAKSKRMSMMPTVSSSRRQSMMSTASGMRRKSMMGGGTGVLKTDPRPIADKSFMRSSIETLIRFLVEHNYDQSISPKVLHRPTGKDFENVLQFLFNLVDPHRRPSGKFADDVTVMFKGLKYPFNISKTSLAAVGSPHTWPALLASLTWLVELLEYDEMAGLSVEDYSELDPEELDSDKQFFIYLKNAYTFFLAGDDASQDRLDEERKSFILHDQQVIMQETQQVEKTKAQLQRQLEEEASQTSLIPELEQRKRDFHSDKLKWEKLIRQFEENKEIMLSKVSEREMECREKEEELAAAQREKEQVQRVLNQQELSPADAERMNQEKLGLEEAKARAQEHHDELQQNVWDLEMSVSKRVQQVEMMIEQYNQTAKSLRLVKESNGTRVGADIVLKLDPIANTLAGAEGTSGIDANAIVKALEELHELSHDKFHQIRTEALELQVKVDENDEEKAAIMAEITALEQRLEHIEEQYQEQKHDMERELSVRAADTERVEEEIHHLKTDATMYETPLQDLMVKYSALQAELEQLEQSNQEELAIVDDEVNKAIDACCGFQEDVAGLLHSLEKDLQSKVQHVREKCEARHTEMLALVESAMSPESSSHSSTS